MQDKIKNIYVLPTYKPSRLSILNSGKLNFGAEFISSSNSKAQNIYITNDKKFVRDEYVTDGIEVISATTKLVDAQGLVDRRDWRKIILTTDQDLIKDGVQAIDDEFLEWFIKNPSCERIEVNGISDVALGGFADVYYKIIIPRATQQIIDEDYAGGLEMGQIPAKEEPKQETLEEVAERFTEEWFKNNDFAKELFIRGAKWQKEQDKKICFAKNSFGLVKHKNNDSDKIEYGDIIDETEGYFLVKPHLKKDNNRWLKVDCEIIEYYN